MPIPKPKKEETKDQFMQRCVDDKVMKNEYKLLQRLAVCTNQWTEKK